MYMCYLPCFPFNISVFLIILLYLMAMYSVTVVGILLSVLGSSIFYQFSPLKPAQQLSVIWFYCVKHYCAHRRYMHPKSFRAWKTLKSGLVGYGRLTVVEDHGYSLSVTQGCYVLCLHIFLGFNYIFPRKSLAPSSLFVVYVLTWYGDRKVSFGFSQFQNCFFWVACKSFLWLIPLPRKGKMVREPRPQATIMDEVVEATILILS